MTESRKQCIMLVVDGLGDLPVPALAGKTPLEAARTPHFDTLASNGLYGLLDPLEPGTVPNTDTGTGMLLGMLPEEAGRLKRGTIEAAGAGRVLREGEVALRANFASALEQQGDLLICDRRAGRIKHGLVSLAEQLDGTDLGGGVRAELYSTEQHRGVLVLCGGELDPAISDTDPGDRELPALLQWCEALRPEAENSARLLNRFIRSSYDLLSDHPVNQARVEAGKKPANIIITRGAGSAIGMNNLINRLGLKAALVSGCNTVRGLGRMFGFDVYLDPGFTASLDTDLDAKVETALRALDDHDMVFIQIKAPDICAHDLDPLGKRDFIERIDSALAPLVDRDLVIALASDHTTDSNTGFHTADPVPAFVHQPVALGGRSTIKFGEQNCRTGPMPRQSSGAFLNQVLQAMGVGPAQQI